MAARQFDGDARLECALNRDQPWIGGFGRVATQARKRFQNAVGFATQQGSLHCCQSLERGRSMTPRFPVPRRGLLGFLQCQQVA